jgi:hypothetical protein
MRAARRDRLFVATLAYLLAPNLVFLASWLSPAWALPTTLVVAVSLVDAWRRAKTATPPATRRQWVFVGAFALASTVLAGIGGTNIQVADYVKHNLLFHDLVVHPWPVVYGHGGGGASLLCYYVAYYLPASLAGKALGIAWTAATSFVWGLAGVVLACAWIARLGRPRGGAVLAVFAFVDGFAWLPGIYTFAQKLGVLPGGPEIGPWWAADGFTLKIASFGSPPMRLLFESEPVHLLWVPQHAIVAWLATACVLRVLLEGGPTRHLGLVLASTVLWSPFVAVGLLPFAVLALLANPRGTASWPGIGGGLALAVPVGLYFLAHSSIQYVGFLPSRFSGPLDWLRYGLFLFGAVGVLTGAVALVRRKTGTPAPEEWRLFVVSAAWLVLTTVVVMGYYDDWVMRVSMPALMVFRLTVARLAVELWLRGGRFAVRAAFATLVVLSADRPIKTCVLAAIGRLPGQERPQTTIVGVTREVPGISQLPGTRDWDYSDQYLGTTTSWFGRHLLKKTSRPGSYSR